MPTLKPDKAGMEDKQANLKQPPQLKATKTRQMHPKMRGHQDQTARPPSRPPSVRKVKPINYDDNADTRRAVRSRGGTSPIAHKDERTDVINRAGKMDVTKDTINIDDDDNLSLDLEDLQLTAELEKEEAEMMKNGEVKNPKSRVQPVHKDKVEVSEKMEDSIEDQQAHLSHLNSRQDERLRKTTEVSKLEYHNRANSGGRQTIPAGGNNTPPSARPRSTWTRL